MAESQTCAQISDHITPNITVSDVEQCKVDFKDRVQTSRYEIQAKFMEFFEQLQSEMVRLLEKLDEIENEVLTKYNSSSDTIMEMFQARQNTLDILKSNSASGFLEKSIEMYDKEIEDIKSNSGINSLFKLKWKIMFYQLEDICEIDLYTNQSIPDATLVSQDYNMEELQRQLQHIAYTEDIGMQLPRDELITEELNTVDICRSHLDNKPWDCNFCTFFNRNNFVSCEACDQFRVNINS